MTAPRRSNVEARRWYVEGWWAGFLVGIVLEFVLCLALSIAGVL